MIALGRAQLFVAESPGAADHPHFRQTAVRGSQSDGCGSIVLRSPEVTCAGNLPDLGNLVLADITRMPCPWRQCISLFTEELPWLSESDKELIMGRAVCEWLGWKLPA